MTRAQSQGAPRLLAVDLMNAPAVVAEETMAIREVARLMLSEGVGAVPILAASGEAIGIASDGDLLGRRLDDGRRAWWLSMLAEGSGADETFAKHGGRPVREVMSAPLISIGPHATAQEIAEALLAHRVKRLPVTEDGRVLGIVSRANLIVVVEGIPRLHLEEERGAGLLSFFESLIGGASLRGGVERPPVAPANATLARAAPARAAPAEQQPKISAEALRASVRSFKAENFDHKEHERKQAELDRRRQVKALINQHLNEQLWPEMIAHAEVAAHAGETELLLLRFPSDLCSDGGRKIDVAEEGWEETLRGEAAEIDDLWRKEMKPQGFGLSARIVSYDDGIIGDIGLYLTWGE
ncbi:CBS domain-containing protein [Roseiarcus sp.]|uniref:CBS domain-containing protein n=1 Tax=Roseiarcus sp. TaxID=1969460 RepID=UPI003F9D40C7